MGWSSNDIKPEKNSTDSSSKILFRVIAGLIFIILLIIILILCIYFNTFKITIDGEELEDYDVNTLVSKIDGITYINIEEFAKLIKYEYHQGEYKSFIIEEDKCYVQGANETSTFYLNDNKVSKLPINDLTSDYREFGVKNTAKEINGKMYALIDAINLAFNVNIIEDKNSLTIFTLDYLVKWYDSETKKWGYTGVSDQNFENQKSILYGYLIVKKENGLYKIINNRNTEEIVSDKYSSIQFSENTKEFFVTNSLGQVGILNIDGTPKIEPIYESISILDKQLELYVVKKDNKYGIVKSGNRTIVSPEYDSMGLNDDEIMSNTKNQYFILDTLIPVCKDNKWGAIDKEGNLIYKLEYDGFGCDITSVELNGTEKKVSSVYTIERCNGVVVKKDKKYGVLDITGKELVPIQVDSIYALESIEDEDERYFMIYNNKELNVIERLIVAGLIEDYNKDNIPEEKNVVENNTVNFNSNLIMNQLDNNVTQ